MRISRAFAFLVLFLFVAAWQSVLSATLEGVVLDPSGQAVPGARVSLKRSLIAIDEHLTDSQGLYRFEGLQSGKYQVTATARGLASSPVEIESIGTEATRKDIHLALSAVVSQVVVSASLGGALVPEIGSSVNLVTREDMEDRAVLNAAEAIRGIPGLEVNETGRRGSVTGVFIRGGESKYNAVLVNGIPVNEFGGTFDWASLPSDGIERIEVIRGPQSALYGPNAVTGVINVISRKGEGRPKFTALAEGGSYNTRRFATGGSGLTRGFSWSYDLSRTDSDGAVQNDNYRNQSAFLNLGLNQSNRQLQFHFFGNANDRGVPGPYGSDPLNITLHQIDTVSRGKQNLFGYQVDYTEQFSPRFRQATTVSFATNDLYYRLYDSYFQSTYSYRAENLRGVFNTRSEIMLSAKDTLTAGFEFNREQIRHSYITDAQWAPFLLPRTSLAYFVENRWAPSERLYVLAGIRFDDLRTHSIPTNGGTRPPIPATSWLKANPRVSIAYIAREGDAQSTMGGTRIHGSFGTGIRPPDGFELTYTNNAHLKPEKNISFDTGLEQRLFANRAVVDFTYFFNRFDDQIVTLGTIDNPSALQSDNLKNSRAQGLEMSFRIQPVRSLSFSGQYTFTDAEVLALDERQDAPSKYKVGDPLLRRPRHSASYTITWTHKRLTLSTNAYIRGIIRDSEPALGYPFFPNKGYTRADAGFSYRLPYGVEVYGRVNNFLNQKYEESLGFPALHINFNAGLRFSFPSE